MSKSSKDTLLPEHTSEYGAIGTEAETKESTGAIPKALTFKVPTTATRSVQPKPDPVPLRHRERNPVRECRKKTMEYHCQLCSQRDTDEMVQCDECGSWFHFACGKVTEDVADRSWVCVRCNNEQTSAPTSTERRPRSKAASSVTSNSTRIAMEIEKLKEEYQLKLELKMEFLQQKYELMRANAPPSKNGSTSGDSARMSKIQDWVDNTERLGAHDDSGLVDEMVMPSSNDMRQPKERPTPEHPQTQRAGAQPNSLRQSTPLQCSAAVPQTLHQLITPQQTAPSLTMPLPTVLGEYPEQSGILNRSQIAARQVVSRDLPHFSGNPEEWPLFFATYHSSSQMCGFTPEENMLRLQKCLKAKALEAVRCRLLHPSNTEGVMSTLKMLYGKPEAIIQSIIRKIRVLPPPKMEKLDTIVNFALTVENLVAIIQACNVPEFAHSTTLRYELVDRLPSTLKLEWAKSSRGRSVSLADFSAWLYATAEDASSVMVLHEGTEYRSERRGASLNLHSESDREPSRAAEYSKKGPAKDTPRCVICHQNCRSVAQCKRFEELSREARWGAVKEHHLCRKCLWKHIGPCKKATPCGVSGCEFLHHPLLHNYKPPTTSAETPDVSCNVHQGQSDIMFRIVPVVLYGPSKIIRTHAFIDDGSELTIMEQSLADELGVQGPTKSLCMRWTGGTQKTTLSQQVNLRISNVRSSYKHKLTGVYTMPSLQIRPQTLRIGELRKKYPYLEGLPIEPYTDVSPRILIGLDHAILGNVTQSREGIGNGPIAVKTRLGWMVFGNCTGRESVERFVNYHSVGACECNPHPDETLHKIVKSHFSLDSLGIISPDKILTSQHDQRAQTLLETQTRLTESGRYESGLLWKYDDVRLPDSKTMAKRRWMCLEKRMNKDPLLAEAVKEKITDHIKKGYIRKLSAAEVETRRSREWYLPIFPVVNPNKPGKIRLVWDAAAEAHGLSLNSFLLKGPDQLASLLSVLIQFREYKVAVSGDIREMFHQVLMRPDDQHCLRFFWKDDEAETEPNVYLMQVMTFGACCSPSTAQYVKNTNAERFKQQYPKAVDAIVKRHYVDDMLVSVETEQEAVQLVQEVKEIHLAGGFEIRNWVSNSSSVLDSITEKPSQEKNLDIGDDSATEKVLGMWWDTTKDCFTYKVSPRYDKELISGKRRPTKREVLRTLMMVFDPLGLIAHVLMQLKALLQEIWRTPLGWDDPIEDAQFEKWLSWLTVFPQIASIAIPRCYRMETPVGTETVVQMHTFVDASESGFAAAVYLRYESGNTIECALAGAKTRVAPLKFLSIPRSELQAAVIGARLADTITQSLSISVSQRTFWTDSKDVLCWLRSDHRRYSQFVAFRVSEILETTEISDWRWVPTKHNVADEGTKWQGAPNLANDSRWLRGPQFLRLNKDDWPVNPFPDKTTGEELRQHFLVHTQPSVSVIHPENFSTWERLLRVTAYARRYIDNLQHECYGKPRVAGNSRKQEFRNAENYLFRRAQADVFAGEQSILSTNREKKNPWKQVPRSSLLYQWDAFLDENDVIRMKGRTKACEFVDRDAAEPIILPRDHPITNLIISSVHNRLHHMNHETVRNEIRQRYRIPRLNAAYRKIRQDCQQCKVLKATPQPPAMGDLPAGRLAAYTRPFTHMGIDYFGPILVSIGRRSEKRWGVLATCLTTRAIHLQIAYTLTTSSCMMAIRNIMARRGTSSVPGDTGRRR